MWWFNWFCIFCAVPVTTAVNIKLNQSTTGKTRTKFCKEKECIGSIQTNESIQYRSLSAYFKNHFDHPSTNFFFNKAQRYVALDW